MSIYEGLAIAALAAAGGFAYYLYRQDMKPRPPGEEPPVSRPMFSRTPPDKD